jgi:hypothetical protein
MGVTVHINGTLIDLIRKLSGENNEDTTSHTPDDYDLATILYIVKYAIMTDDITELSHIMQSWVEQNDTEPKPKLPKHRFYTITPALTYDS